jgi:hypothetical protein
LEKPPRILFGLTLLWLIAFVIAFSDAGVPFPMWILLESAFVILGVTWIVRIVVALIKKTPQGRLVQSQLRYFVSIPVILIVATALGGSPTLLATRVYLSEDSLVHTQTSNGPDDRWIGLFHVRETWRFDDEVRFLTNECGLVDNCGIVFSPDAPPKNRGEDSFTHLYGPWWHWYQSW